MKKLILLFFVGVVSSISLSAQISEGGTPPSFNYPDFSNLRSFNKSDILTIPVEIDRDQLIKEDKLAKEIAAPLRIAVSVPVLIDINNTGRWSVLPDGTNIWQQTIELPQAEGLIVKYKEFYIPEGGKLFVYSEDKSQVLGAYTEKTNPNNGGEFSNQMLYADKITLEYVASSTSKEQPRLVIDGIGYAYNLKQVNSTLADDLTCFVDVNCEAGNDWKNQIRGTVHIQMQFYEDWYVCSGALVNNTAQDGKPYILTAHHCFYDTGITANFTTAAFYFNYENSTCNPKLPDSPMNQVLVGCNLKVNIPIKGGSDGLLLELKSAIPSSYNVYYNGWDVNSAVPTSGAIIHHPAGIEKKISKYTQKPTITRWYEGTCSSCSNGVNNGHLEVYYSEINGRKSVTAGGSSGSPMFNQNGLIVGTLTGGSTYCVDTWEKGQYIGGPNESDLYGRLWYHYDQANSASQRMKTYLDPIGLGVRTLNGYDPNGIGNSIDVIEEQVDLRLFPNPVSEELYINALEIIEKVQVYDMLGRLIYESEGDKSSTMSIPVSGWNKSIYNVIVKTVKGQFTDKIIKN